VAGLTSSDRQGDCTHGAIEGQDRHVTASAAGGLVDELTLRPHTHAFSLDVRQRSARQREQTAQFRLETARARDAVSHARDVAALGRDQAAAARDRAAAEREASCERESGAPAQQPNVDAAEQRVLAAQDRLAASRDREHAARDRLAALADREILARRLTVAETDPVTGARTRAAGLVDLDGELSRCRRTGAPLVVVYVDVVGSQEVSDAEGHDAGDELLHRVVALIREHVRSYDLVVRLRDDEFLCVMSGVTVPGARRRFEAIGTMLDTIPSTCMLRTGFAELMPGESAVELIKRADVDHVASRYSPLGS
jgi:diguanylate cyclase (GGDEF)-like protein